MTNVEELLEDVKHIGAAMDDVCKIYRVTRDQITLVFHQTGVITINIKGKPKLFFFDESELIKWAACK